MSSSGGTALPQPAEFGENGAIRDPTEKYSLGSIGRLADATGQLLFLGSKAQ